MTAPLVEFHRGDFEELLGEHQRLIELANDVEFCLHALPEGLGEQGVQALQKATGGLLQVLRQYLFRQDQQVLPILDRLSRHESVGGG